MLLPEVLPVIFLGHPVALHNPQERAGNRGETMRAFTDSQGHYKLSEHLGNRFATSCGLCLRLPHKTVIHSQSKLRIHDVQARTTCTSRQSSFCGLTAARMERSILIVRGEKVLMDHDLTGLYGVEPRAIGTRQATGNFDLPIGLALRRGGGSEGVSTLRTTMPLPQPGHAADWPASPSSASQTVSQYGHLTSIILLLC